MAVSNDIITIFDISPKIRRKAAATPQTLLLANKMDSCGSKSTGFNLKDEVVKMLSLLKVTGPTLKKGTFRRHFRTHFLGVRSHFEPRNDSVVGVLGS